MSRVEGALVGAAAGAAGTTALNAVTYLDMALRGRAASTTPQDAVEKLASVSHIRIPGDDDAQANRVAGLGPLLGIAAGIGVGAALGVVRQRTGLRPGLATAVLAGAGAMAAGNGPLAVMRLTNPADWSLADWMSDIVPHLAYGGVTGYVLDRLRSP
jgi:hypothetical protein